MRNKGDHWLVYCKWWLFSFMQQKETVELFIFVCTDVRLLMNILWCRFRCFSIQHELFVEQLNSCSFSKIANLPKTNRGKSKVVLHPQNRYQLVDHYEKSMLKILSRLQMTTHGYHPILPYNFKKVDCCNDLVLFPT